MDISVVIVSKDEPQLEATLNAVWREATSLGVVWEVIVVDASRHRLDWIRVANPWVRWLDFEPPRSVVVSIPHQRNLGVQVACGDIVVFTDCGCEPTPGWLARLVRPLVEGGEQVTVGRTVGRGLDLYDANRPSSERYLRECSTINIAVRRSVFDEIGGFDEGFEYGSDVDFAWRLVDAGIRLRNVPDAVVTTDWGDVRRQLRRAWVYGRARTRLYMKHRTRLSASWRHDPVAFAYAAFLLGLPLTAKVRLYPALLLVAAMRNRRTGALVTVADHLVFSAGSLRELIAHVMPACGKGSG